MHDKPYLTDPEIDDVCSPLVQPAAQGRYLAGLGLRVQRKPNGRPLVGRSDFERVMTGGTNTSEALSASAAQPDRAALTAHLQRGKKNGSQAQRQ